jgi:hypothetical protein
VFNNVHFNEGGAYDGATGYFTVPTAGVYYLIGSAGPWYANTGSYFYLYVDNTRIDESYAYTHPSPEMSSVHGVIHLHAG